MKKLLPYAISLKKFGKEVFAVMFATPAALGIIGKLDDRLDLGKLLERIVLSYSELIAFVKNSLTDIIAVSLDQAEALLFCLFVALSTLGGGLLGDKKDRQFAWGIISGFSCFSYLFVFGVDDTFFIGGQILDPVFEIGSALLLLAMLKLALRLGEAGKFPTSKLSIRIARFAFWALLLLLPIRVYYYFSETYHLKYDPLPNSLNVFDFALASFVYIFFLAYALFCFITRNKGPAYASLFVLGVLAINFLADVFIPETYEFLDNL